MNAALELAGVHKSFGATPIIRGVDLRVRAGERHAIIGPNGAGKSTLFDLVSGRHRVSAGAIRLAGETITDRAPYELHRRGLGRSFQITNIFPRLSTFENVRCAALWSSGMGYACWRLVSRQRALNERSALVLEEVGLAARRDIPAGVLSYAEQRALEIGIAIAGDPSVLLLDEPTAGMSSGETRAAVELVRRISEGRTLIMVEHDMSVVFDLADRISVLVYGEIIASDTPARIRADPRVQEAYLAGTTHE